MTKKLLQALKKESHAGIPFWFMRQAGRYLPEYKQLRSTTKGFLDYCYTPEKASEATLQPIRRFGMDGAVIFSDILVVPDALGVDVRFEEKVGPVLVPVRDEASLDKLKWKGEKLAPVYEALRLTRAALPRETTLLGFAGSPWTLASYIIYGKGSRDFQEVRSLALSQPKFFSRLLDLLVESVTEHTKNQIKAGAEVIQLFDSWAGVLSAEEFSQYVIVPTQKIVANLKTAYPHIPIIGFPRQAGVKYKSYAIETGVDGVSVDSSVPLQWIARELQPICVVQGNLDPILLAENKEAALAQAKKIVAILGDKSFVFNLGHGILPHTPIENVQAVCEYLKSI